jgi:phosphatidylethanolamine/phosphatidyl-N-methylethanolamine N-methyltransferase
MVRRAEGFTLFGRFCYNDRVLHWCRNPASPRTLADWRQGTSANEDKHKRSRGRVTKAVFDSSDPDTVPDGNAGLTFFRQWLRAPRRMGSVAPSSHHLARAMARQIPAQALAEKSAIVELGGGTGSITRGLLEAGVKADRLFVVERDPTLAELLRSRFTGAHVLCGDATSLPALLQPFGIHRVGAIVSGLPLLLFPEPVLAQLVDACFALLGSAHPLIQFTYGLKSPLASQSERLTARRVAWVPRNLPPAFVWTYRRAA